MCGCILLPDSKWFSAHLLTTKTALLKGRRHEFQIFSSVAPIPQDNGSFYGDGKWIVKVD
jgi:hypothetical protein